MNEHSSIVVSREWHSFKGTTILFERDNSEEDGILSLSLRLGTMEGKKLQHKKCGLFLFFPQNKTVFVGYRFRANTYHLPTASP